MGALGPCVPLPQGWVMGICGGSSRSGRDGQDAVISGLHVLCTPGPQ